VKQKKLTGLDGARVQRELSSENRLATSATTFTPRAADINLLNSWLARAYPTAGIQTSWVPIVGKIHPPFNDDTCIDVDAQLSGLRGNDVSNGSVDPHTHYYGLVSDSGGQVANGKGFMRGCSDLPSTPDPSATGSGPAGSGWPGDSFLPFREHCKVGSGSR